MKNILIKTAAALLAFSSVFSLAQGMNDQENREENTQRSVYLRKLAVGRYKIDAGNCPIGTAIANVQIIAYGTSEIPRQYFKGCKAIKNLIIGDGITAIGEDAFRGSTELKALVILGNPKLRFWVFADCLRLAKVRATKLKEVNECCFSGCENLKEVTLSSVDAIMAKAFEGCNNLTTLDCPSCIEIVIDSAFKGCTKLTTRPSIRRHEKAMSSVDQRIQSRRYTVGPQPITIPLGPNAHRLRLATPIGDSTPLHELLHKAIRLGDAAARKELKRRLDGYLAEHEQQ